VAALRGSFVIFALIAVLVLDAADRERDAPALITLGVFFAYLLHADTVLTSAYLDVGRVALPKTPLLILGLGIIAAGMVLFVWSTRVLVGRGRFEGIASTRLVRSGPYAWMRHPQDAGWATMLLGLAIAGRTVIGLALVGVFAIFVLRVWRIDERQLAARFGEEHAEYRRTTPAIGLPGRRPRRAAPAA